MAAELAAHPSLFKIGCESCTAKQYPKMTRLQETGQRGSKYGKQIKRQSNGFKKMAWCLGHRGNKKEKAVLTRTRPSESAGEHCLIHERRAPQSCPTTAYVDTGDAK